MSRYTVELYSRNAGLLKLLTSEFSGQRIKINVHPPEESAPAVAAFLVTRRALSSQLEHYAAKLGAMPCVMPEGSPYVAAKIKAAAKDGGMPLVLVGDDMSKPYVS